MKPIIVQCESSVIRLLRQRQISSRATIASAIGTLCRRSIFLLTIITAAISVSSPAFPQEFSWNHVPLYAELSKNTGDFTPDEVRFLASHFSLITVEKTQSLKQRGDAAEGTKVAIAQLKAANPKLKVLVYWNAYVDYERLYKALQRPIPDAWFLANGVGIQHAGPWRRFDVSNPEFRQWWIDQAVKLVQDTGADGIFVDGFPQIAANPNLLAAQLGPAKTAAIVDSAHEMLKELRSKLGNSTIIVFNGLRSMPDGWTDGGASFLKYTSGALVEHFAFLRNTSKEQIAADMKLIEAAGAGGKIVIVKGWPATAVVGGNGQPPPDDPQMPAEADRDLDFPLACFLIVASDHSYFSYSWGYRTQDGWFHWYPAFDRELGPPLGAASRDGWRFKRSFAHADVSVDLQSKAAAINWH